MSGYLGREAILAATDLAFEEVQVPEWGGVVRVRGMTGVERDEWETSLLEARGEDKRANRRQVRATLVALTVVDAEGRRIFSTADVESLGAKSARALQRVYDVAQRLSRIGAEDIKELQGNSNAGPGGGSPSR